MPVSSRERPRRDQRTRMLEEPVPRLVLTLAVPTIISTGMSIVIIREDLIREDLPEFVPTYLRYKTHADADSLYNTPNCWSIYCCGKVFQYLLANGGLEAMAQRNEEKAAVLYDFLDRSQFFTAAVRKEDRSLMNVPFVTDSDELNAKFVKEAEAAPEYLENRR